MEDSEYSEMQYERILYALQLRVENIEVFVQEMFMIRVMHTFESITY
jgi:hypothetical protein